MPDQKVIELFDSQSGGTTVSGDGSISRDVELKWLVSQLKGYYEAEQKGLTLAPLYFSGHRRTRLESRSIGHGWYEITAAYGDASLNPNSLDNPLGNGFPDKPAAQSIAFDTTGATEHVTQSWSDSEDPNAFRTVYDSEGIPASPPNFGGAVNVSGDDVRGVDITVPSFSWTETWLMPANALFYKPPPTIKNVGGEKQKVESLSYVEWLYRLTGTVNKHSFRSFDEGEVLFLGARCEFNRGATMAALTMSFAARRTRKDFAVGTIKVANKNGWDFLWIIYESSADSTAVVKRPQYAYVERVYEYVDFAPLNIGGEGWPAAYLPDQWFEKE